MEILDQDQTRDALKHTSGRINASPAGEIVKAVAKLQPGQSLRVAPEDYKPNSTSKKRPDLTGAFSPWKKPGHILHGYNITTRKLIEGGWIVMRLGDLTASKK